MRLPCYSSVVIAVLLLSPGLVLASGNRILDASIDSSKAIVTVGVANTTANSVIPVAKYAYPSVAKKLAFRALRFPTTPWGAVLFGAGMILLDDNANGIFDSGDDILKPSPYDYMPGTWYNYYGGPSSHVTGSAWETILSLINAYLPTQGATSFQINTTSCYGSGASGCYDFYVGYALYDANGTFKGNSCARAWRSSTNQPAGYEKPGFYDGSPATETEIWDSLQNFMSSNPSDFSPFQDEFGRISEEIMNGQTEPVNLSQAQRDELQADLNGVCDSGDSLIYGLCVLGQEHGITNAPTTSDVPASEYDPTVTTGGGTSGQQIEIPVDTPGGPFVATELEPVDSFQVLTQGFLDSVSAAPIVSAWTGIGSSVPSGSCPSADITAFGQSHSLTQFFCQIWEDAAVPVLSLVFLFVWPFVGLRIIMSA